MKTKNISKMLFLIVSLLLFLTGCVNNNKEPIGSSTTKQSESVATSTKIEYKLKGLYTCYKWEEENYDSRIRFKSLESNGNTPHMVFSFEDGKINIAGTSGTEILEWYEGTYEKVDGDVYEFNVQYACSDTYPNCSAKKKVKEDLKGTFSYSNRIMYYENNKQKKCEVGGPTYY